MEYPFRVGVGKVDITPETGCFLVGGLWPVSAEVVETPLFAKSIVISHGDITAAIVTLDTLIYPIAEDAAAQASEETGIPAGNIFIVSSHTHSGPLYRDYNDRLRDSVIKSLKLALDDLSDCAIGISKETAGSIIHNRRVIKEGYCVNTWLLPDDERTGRWPAAGMVDDQLQTLSFMGPDGKYKALLFNFSCHPCNASEDGAISISADYPGFVRKYVNDKLGYETEVLFIPGACGNINGLYNRRIMGETLADAIVRSLGKTEFCAAPKLDVVTVKTEIPERAAGEFRGEWVSLFWKNAYEFFRNIHKEEAQCQKRTHTAAFSGIRIGDDIAIVTNQMELFAEVGLAIKGLSPFRHTIISQLTNGHLGYLPTIKGFEQGGYETLYGWISHLDVTAAETVRIESLNALEKLKRK